MKYKFSKRSVNNLSDVHLSLWRVAVRALEISKYDFGITCGSRTVEEQELKVEEGSSLTMDSKHLIQADGFSHAIDFAVYVDGKITWEHKYYRKVMQAFVTAAVELGVQIELGGLWESLVDGPHVQLASI